MNFVEFQHDRHFNTGVIAFQSNSKVFALIDLWFKIIDQFEDDEVRSDLNCDQTIFNEQIVDKGLLQSMGIQIKTFSNQIWNVRPTVYNELMAKSKISSAILIHAREHEISKKNKWVKLASKIKQRIISNIQ